MSKTWILVANASQARIYFMNTVQNLHLLKTLEHPDSRKKIVDLVTDSPGNFAKHGQFTPRANPKKVEADHFAKEITDVLEHGRNENDFDSLILVTPPSFQGKLNKHMSSPLRHKIYRTISKDYHAIPEKKLLSIVRGEHH